MRAMASSDAPILTAWMWKWSRFRRSIAPTEESTDAASREHVTQYIYRHPEKFRLAHLTQTPDLGQLR